MEHAVLSVVGQEKRKSIQLEPDGIIIGRHPSCDFVLEDRSVSRRHARLYKDPFGRWIIEDLQSRNGVWVEDTRVQARRILPGNIIRVGRFDLTVQDMDATRFDAANFAKSAETITVDQDTAVLTPIVNKAGQQETLSIDLLKQLNRITDRLGSISEIDALYPTICRQLLSGLPDSVAMVLSLPGVESVLPETHKPLAYCVASRDGNCQNEIPPNLHLSRGVLDAVRTTQAAAMAGGGGGDINRLDLTIQDDIRPRTVFCAPLNSSTEDLEVLYLDLPSEKVADGYLDFIQAVSRHVGVARGSLLLAHARMQQVVMEEQLELARHIQMGLTPDCRLDIDGVEIAAHYEPAMWVGGDYLDIWISDVGKIIFALGDVCGKGLPAAMIMSNLQAALRTTLSFCDDLPHAVTRISEHLGEHIPQGRFVTMMLGILDPQTHRLDYINAGHLIPVLITPDNSVESLGMPKNFPLALNEGEYIADSIDLEQGTTIVVVSDGITEAFSPERKAFGDLGLKETLESEKFPTCGDLVEKVVADVNEFAGDLPQGDDMTVLALRITGKRPLTKA